MACMWLSRRLSTRNGSASRMKDDGSMISLITGAIIELDECERSDPPLSRDVDGQVLDPRLLNWLRIELHQLHDLERHTHFHRETQRARFPGGKGVIMRPMSARELSRKGLRRRLLHPRRQQLYRPLLDLGERLLRHISKNQREVEDALNRLRVTGFDDARGRESSDGSIGPSTENSPSTISSAASAINVPPDMA